MAKSSKDGLATYLITQNPHKKDEQILDKELDIFPLREGRILPYHSYCDGLGRQLNTLAPAARNNEKSSVGLGSIRVLAFLCFCFSFDLLYEIGL